MLKKYLLVVLICLTVVGCGEEEKFVFKSHHDIFQVTLSGDKKFLHRFPSSIYLGKGKHASKWMYILKGEKTFGAELVIVPENWKTAEDRAGVLMTQKKKFLASGDFKDVGIALVKGENYTLYKGAFRDIKAYAVIKKTDNTLVCVIYGGKVDEAVAKDFFDSISFKE